MFWSSALPKETWNLPEARLLRKLDFDDTLNVTADLVLGLIRSYLRWAW